jgi:hypothetical protein
MPNCRRRLRRTGYRYHSTADDERVATLYAFVHCLGSATVSLSLLYTVHLHRSVSSINHKSQITMSLRLSSSVSSSLTIFEQDVNVSAVEKSNCFKFLSVILKNLLKSGEDPKYRQLRLSNAKVQRITAHAAVMAFLKQTIGFETVQEDGESLLKIVSNMQGTTVLEAALSQVTTSQERVSLLLPRTVSNSSSAASLPDVQLTEKQKYRKVQEEKDVLEKEEARAARKRTVAQIKADKHTRENDPNWKPSVNAAAAKAGDSINTFRDKFGEE